MKTRRTRWLVSTLTLIAALALALAACATPAAETPTEAPATSPPAQEEPTEPPMEEPTEAPMEEPTKAPMEEPTEAEVMLPEEPLLVLEWSGYEATDYPMFYQPFTGVYTGSLDQVLEYTFFADDAEAYAKMQTGVNADILHPCNSWWELYVDSGLVQPIDTSQLSNWDEVHPDLAAMGEFDGQQYFVPWDWGYESILVRTDLVPEMPTSWNDLWDEQYAGHVSIWDSAETNYVMAALALGIEDPWNTTPEQDEAIKQKLIDLKPNLLTYWSDYTESYDLPAAGDVWLLANAWQDAYAYLDSDGYEVAYIQPEEGRLGWVCGFGVGATAENLDLIYEFLDSTISRESVAALANIYWYGGSNTAALDLIDPYVVEFMELDQVDTLTERTVFYQPLTEEQRAERTNLWDEVKAAP